MDCDALTDRDGCFGSSTVNIPNITQDDMIKTIRRLKSGMTSAPNKIPRFFIKDCMFQLLEPLLLVFNKSLETGVFSTKWKISKVCPILKLSDLSEIKNYRPISLLCNFAKIFESVIHSYILPCSQEFYFNKLTWFFGSQVYYN